MSAEIWAQARRLHDLGRLGEAARLYELLLQQGPPHPFPIHMLGVIHGQQGRIHKALDLIGHAAVLAPDHPVIQADYANALRNAGRPEDALAVLAKTLDRHPDFPLALEYRGAVLWAQGRLAEAADDLGKAAALQPGRSDLMYNIGTIFEQLGQFDQALDCFDGIVALEPGNFDARNTRGWMRLQLGRFAEALADFEQVTRMAPTFAGGQLNLGLYRLLMEDWRKGLPLYEWRRKLPGQNFVRTYRQPCWTGREDIRGKSILVHAEQGLGDAIQFCRFLTPLHEMGAAIHFAVPAMMRRLFQRGALPATLCGLDHPADQFDYHIPLMSLPLAFATEAHAIPCQQRYLRAEPEKEAHWANRVGNTGFRIGVIWHGRDDAAARSKSFPLALLAPLAHLEGVRLISLQKGDSTAELQTLPSGMRVEAFPDMDAGTDAFVDTAAIMANMDLVISADSAPAHLAGALGVATWVALKHVPDWRWFLNRRDTPWYPGMRLFRQPAQGDWASVVQAMTGELETLRDLTGR